MATQTQNISSFSGVQLQSPRVALNLVKGGEVESASEGTSRAKSAKTMISAAPPRLDPSPPAPSGNASGYVSQLIAYMQSLLEAQIQMAQNDEKLNATQNKMGGDMIQVSQALVEKAQKDLQNYLDALEKEKHESFWQKLAAGLGMVFGFVAGLVTGDFALCAFSIMMGVFVLSGGSDALQNAIGSAVHADWLKAIINVAMAVGAAVLTCGASGAMSTEEVVAEEATEAGVSETTDAAATVGDNTATVADTTANTVEENTESALSKAQNFGSKVLKNGFKSGKNFFGQTLMMTMVFNPYTELATSAMDLAKKMGAKISDSTEQEVSQVLGMIAALAAAVWGGSMTMSNSSEELSGFGKKLADKFGETMLDRTRSFLHFTRGALFATSGALGIAQGVLEKKASGIIDDMGKTQSNQTLCQAIIDSLNQQAQATQQNMKQMDDVFAAMNSRWNAFVQPYVLEPQLMA